MGENDTRKVEDIKRKFISRTPTMVTKNYMGSSWNTSQRTRLLQLSFDLKMYSMEFWCPYHGE